MKRVRLCIAYVAIGRKKHLHCPGNEDVSRTKHGAMAYTTLLLPLPTEPAHLSSITHSQVLLLVNSFRDLPVGHAWRL